MIERTDITGPVNLAAPTPLTQRDFMTAMREASGMRVGSPATKWMVEIGAVFMRTDTELILKSRPAALVRLLEAGFTFHFPDGPLRREISSSVGELSKLRVDCFTASVTQTSTADAT